MSLKDLDARREYHRKHYSATLEHSRAVKRAYYHKRMADPAYRAHRLRQAMTYYDGGCREAVVENLLVSLCEKNEWLIRKLSYVGRRGCPDRLVILPGGGVHFIELKKPRGGALSIQQKLEHEAFANAGANVAVLWSTAEVESWILAHGGST